MLYFVWGDVCMAKQNINKQSFEDRLRNVKATLEVEGVKISKTGLNNLKRIESGEMTYTEVIEALKKKYMQVV